MTLLLGVSGTAMGEVCTTNTGQPSTFVMALPAKINIDPDVGEGNVLADIRGTMMLRSPTETRCPGISGEVPNKYMLSSGAYLGGSIYESGIPGVGVRFSFNESVFPLENKFIFPYMDSHSWPARLQLVKTGPISQSGSLAGLRGGAYLTSNGNHEWRVFVFSGATDVDAGRPTCRVVTPLVPVPMGSAMLKHFNGIGSTVGGQSFKIAIYCEGGRPQISTAVYGLLMDQNDPQNSSTTLSLSSGSTATGIGMQVLHAGQVLAYGGSSGDPGAGARWFAGRTRNGNFDIPLEARYVQTQPVVTAGSANAKAAFVLSYE
ncbi:fimbrial protein [Stenotrophomonas sp. SY1]|uniref:fimbrial protein n=1 Tax=Stenotrophomonas sp. SY1 TaxID=477235 RepID=UPI001E4FBE8F|nr:fimbrial protein [Stenotrophomonas sp. SY1]